jgi:hypothetical protein
MTIVKDNKVEQMDNISKAKIQKIDEIHSDAAESDNGERLEDALDQIEDFDDSVGDITKPKVTLRFRSARFTYLWDLNATNVNCICEKRVTCPTETELEKRMSYLNYTMSRCGCAYHSACINQYVKSLGQNDANMINCPICHTKYEPLPNLDKVPDTGIYQDV